jgi:hypothetical protein
VIVLKLIYFYKKNNLFLFNPIAQKKKIFSVCGSPLSSLEQKKKQEKEIE